MVKHYIAVRRAAGFKLEGLERYLGDFANFASERGEPHVVAKTAIEWAAQGSSETQRDNRLQIVIRFARFIRAEDARHEIPPHRVFCRRRQRPTPYIFTEQEIQTLLTEAAKLGPPGSLRPSTYKTLLGLLAVTGLRLSEALALRFDDVTPDGLMIRETKFRKSRLVPLHNSTAEALQRYLIKRNECMLDDDHVFVSQRRRRPLGGSTVRETFYQLLNAAGIPSEPGQPRPRLMDLRHSFATTALTACPDNREAVRQHMLALMTYMGHARVESTFYYQENTPQLLDGIAQACESYFERMPL